MKIYQYACRILLRMRSYSLISLVGLIISLTGTLIIARYVYQELTVDHYIPALDRTFLLTETSDHRVRWTSNRDWNHDPNFIDPLNSPKVECHTTFIPLSDGEVICRDKAMKARIIPTDSLFLEILPRKVIAGNRKLSTPTDAIVTDKFARHLFGNENPIGQTLKIADKLVTITGVIDAPATKSTFNYDLLVSLELNRMWGRVEITLARLYNGQDMEALNAEQKPLELRSNNNIPSLYQLFPLSKFYFDENVHYYGDSIIKKGNQRNVWILILVAAMLMTIGIFNYLNIYTVMMLKRSREFGIKKVYGAGYREVLKQIYLENFNLSAISLFFSWLLIEVSGGLIANELDIPIQSNLLFDLTLSGIVLFVFPFVMSLPPVVRYVRSAPITSIRSVRLGGHSVWSRTAFLFLQYVITINLIVISLYFMKQLHFMLNADLGYHTKDIIECDIYPDNHRDERMTYEEHERKRAKEKQVTSAIVHRMDACPLFEQWTFGETFQQLQAGTDIKKADSDQEYQQVAATWLSNDLMDIFDIQLVEGRRWNDSTDVFAQYKLIVNETVLKMFDIRDIRHDLLQTKRRIWWSMGTDENLNPPFEIVGVIKDFNTNHLSKATLPIICLYAGGGNKEDVRRGIPLIARIVPGKRQEAIRFLTQLHTELVGDGELGYTFIEDEVAAMYENDQRTSKIYILFATLAILVSCLGLLGLSLFDIRQRYREIALRKVNGATMKDLIPLLVRKYLFVLGSAVLVAVPMSYLAIQKYMEGFAHRAPLSAWIYVLAMALVLLITIATLFWQVRKAVGIEPAKIMKYE